MEDWYHHCVRTYSHELRELRTRCMFYEWFEVREPWAYAANKHWTEHYVAKEIDRRCRAMADQLGSCSQCFEARKIRVDSQQDAHRELNMRKKTSEAVRRVHGRVR